jgi:hypothetical protein
LTKKGNNRLFSTFFDNGFLNSGLIDRIFALIIPNLVATNVQDESVVQIFKNLNFIDYGKTERHY